MSFLLNLKTEAEGKPSLLRGMREADRYLWRCLKKLLSTFKGFRDGIRFLPFSFISIVTYLSLDPGTTVSFRHWCRGKRCGLWRTNETNKHTLISLFNQKIRELKEISEPQTQNVSYRVSPSIAAWAQGRLQNQQTEACTELVLTAMQCGRG